jgi:hypothetical protein
VKRPAEERMWVCYDSGIGGIRIAGIEQGLKAASRAVQR